MRPTCGCGKLADCLVYEDKREPHCKECAFIAAETDGGVVVYVPVDWREWENARAAKSNKSA